MLRYAVIHRASLEVQNVILWDGESQWSPPQGYFVVQNDYAAVSDVYDPDSKSFLRAPQITTIKE